MKIHICRQVQTSGRRVQGRPHHPCRLGALTTHFTLLSLYPHALTRRFPPPDGRVARCSFSCWRKTTRTLTTWSERTGRDFLSGLRGGPCQVCHLVLRPAPLHEIEISELCNVCSLAKMCTALRKSDLEGSIVYSPAKIVFRPAKMLRVRGEHQDHQGWETGLASRT